MRAIGVTIDMEGKKPREWFPHDQKLPAPPHHQWLYTNEATTFAVYAAQYQHIGYIFPNDPGGTIFPNKLTGGQHAVAAYVKRLAPPVVEPDPREQEIAALQKRVDEQHALIMKMRAGAKNDYLERAAFAALSALVQNPNVKGMVEEVGALAYAVAEAMLTERERRHDAPATDQE